MNSNREKLLKGNNITMTSNVEPLIDLSVINPDNYSNVSVESVLKFYRSKYPKKLKIGHANINSEIFNSEDDYFMFAIILILLY